LSRTTSLARNPQPVGKTEQHACRQAVGNGKWPRCLVRTDLNLLQFAQVIDLGRKIRPSRSAMLTQNRFAAASYRAAI
jgi:hypothetical protein